MRAENAAPRAKTGTARLFLALWPGPGTRMALQAWRDAWTWGPRASPVASERLHLTLHFIGDVPCGRVSDVTHALQVAWRPFDLVFGHAELWPNGVALLRPQTVPERLLQLHAALREALHKADLPTERRAFRPHVTLARSAQGATPPSQGPELHWRVRAHALVESRPDASARYRVLQRYAPHA